MKKIGIDARLYSQTGVGTYLKNLLYYLDKKHLTDVVFYIYLMEQDYDKVSLKNKNLVKRKADYRWHTLSEQTGFLKSLNSDNLDLMHFTYFSYPILYQKKFIATVHDATPLLFKTGRASTKNPLTYAIKHFFFRIILKTQVGRAIMIITPTVAVKNELINIYGKETGKRIIPIPEGVSYQMEREKENSSLKGKYGKFFLYVGNFYPHKNVGSLVSAFKNIDTDHKLLLVGPDDYFTERLQGDLRKQDKIIIIKNPALADLIFFYKNAEALVHPSMSEGFGLPIVEAAYFNCPVIASNIPVFNELLGKKYLSFSPYDPNDIAVKIKRFMENKPTFDYKGIIGKFSFERMTDKTLEIYKGLTA
jgi:glycosyltransferase involved in cell wall biosynthesis